MHNYFKIFDDRSSCVRHNQSQICKSKKPNSLKGYNYRKISGCSVIDESLFGEPERLKKIKEPFKLPNTIFTQLEPGDMHEKSVFLSKDDLDRIHNRTHILSGEELFEKEQSEKALKEKLMQESTQRREEMKKLDMERRANEKLNDLEEEARKQSQHLLTKAMEQRQDEEEEIKQLNSAITNAKIQAIRDAQLLEKEQIKKEIAEENDRLDRMMEIDRQNALKIQAAIEAKRKEEVTVIYAFNASSGPGKGNTALNRLP
ncbi:hypothetical protein ACTXT7_011313 [Hymenolepis weldensis]